MRWSTAARGTSSPPRASSRRRESMRCWRLRAATPSNAASIRCERAAAWPSRRAFVPSRRRARESASCVTTRSPGARSSSGSTRRSSRRGCRYPLRRSIRSPMPPRRRSASRPDTCSARWCCRSAEARALRVRCLPGGGRAALASPPFDESPELFPRGRLERWRLKPCERLAPHGRRALRRGLRARLDPRAIVAPIGDQRRIERIAVALHGVRRREEVSTGADFGYRIDTDFLRRRRYRLKELGEHLQHLDIENELLERRGESAFEPAGGVQHEMAATEQCTPQA